MVPLNGGKHDMTQQPTQMITTIMTPTITMIIIFKINISKSIKLQNQCTDGYGYDITAITMAREIQLLLLWLWVLLWNLL